MKTELTDYLREIRSHLHLESHVERRVLGEFYSHILEKKRELEREGESPQTSVRSAIVCFGRPQVVARMMYEAHSRGSWRDALITAIPHFLVAALFFGHYWRQPILAPFTFASIVGVTLLGWGNGKPSWLFSWVGYSVFPLLVGAFSLERVVTGSVVCIITGESTVWSWLLLLPVVIFYSLSLCLILYAVYKIGRRDWVLATVMIVPQPILGFWLFKIHKMGSFFAASGANLHQWDMPMGTVFLLLGVTLAVFIRLRQRLLKAGSLILIGVLSGVFVIFTIWGELSFLALLSIVCLMFLLYVSPSLIPSRNHKEKDESTFRCLPV